MNKTERYLKKGDNWFDFILHKYKYGDYADRIGYIECIIERVDAEEKDMFGDFNYFFELTWNFYDSEEKTEFIARVDDMESFIPAEYWGRPQDFHLGNRKVSDLVERGLTYTQARRYAMSEYGQMTYEEIANFENVKIPSVQDSVESARDKLG